MNLSCTDRPVWTPVSTANAPAEVSRPSPWVKASSMSSASLISRFAVACREERASFVIVSAIAADREIPGPCHANLGAAGPDFADRWGVSGVRGYTSWPPVGKSTRRRPFCAASTKIVLAKPKPGLKLTKRRRVHAAAQRRVAGDPWWIGPAKPLRSRDLAAPVETAVAPPGARSHGEIPEITTFRRDRREPEKRRPMAVSCRSGARARLQSVSRARKDGHNCTGGVQQAHGDHRPCTRRCLPSPARPGTDQTGDRQVSRYDGLRRPGCQPGAFALISGALISGFASTRPPCRNRQGWAGRGARDERPG